uniref:BTB domain-containing protein n=1 Tax=Panagrolaimus davidi TaxID=227884 RepID=A0A914QCP4_9BILA
MSIKDKLNILPLFDKDVDLEICGLDETFDEYCFDISINAKKLEENKYVIILKVTPQEGTNYELIVDYFLMINEKCFTKERDYWKKKEVLENVIVSETKVRICFGVSVKQALIAENLTQKTSFRYYRILCAGTTFYINPTFLKKLECSLFTKWYNDEVTHESCTIVQELTEDELALLLNACCGYSSIVIHSRNIYEIGEIALQFRIVGVIRAIDAHVRSLKFMHPVRKLEMALFFRLTQVADEIIREYKNSMERLNLLHEYLKENGEEMCDMHPDVLKMLDIYDDYIVL